MASIVYNYELVRKCFSRAQVNSLVNLSANQLERIRLTMLKILDILEFARFFAKLEG